MEQMVSEKAKGISRFLASLSGLAGFWLAYMMLRSLLDATSFSNIFSSIFLLIFTGIIIGVCIYLFWLTVQLWSKDDLKYIRRWAVVPAVLTCFLIEWAFSEACKLILGYYHPNADVLAPLSGMSSFVGLAGAGMVYVWTKHLIYRWIDRTELVNPITFRGHRKRYFGWLAFFFWSGMFSIYELLDELGYLSMTEDIGFALPFMLISPLIGLFFYKFCVKIFVTRPLKRLQPE